MSYVYAPYVPLIVTTLPVFQIVPISRVGQVWMLENECIPYMVVKSYKDPFRRGTIMHNMEPFYGGRKRTWKECEGWRWQHSPQHKRIL